ncbi:MAG: pilus assembly protein PilB, partial [Terriglobia bacterium]
CESCKHAVRYPREVLGEAALPYEEWKNVPFYEGTGCIECHGTGFRGRTAICELLDLSDQVREMIVDKKPTSEIKHAAEQEGMMFLREAGIEKVREGVTTLRELNKVTFIEATGNNG